MGGKVFGKVASLLERDSKREGGWSATIGSFGVRTFFVSELRWVKFVWVSLDC